MANQTLEHKLSQFAHHLWFEDSETSSVKTVGTFCMSLNWQISFDQNLKEVFFISYPITIHGPRRCHGIRSPFQFKRTWVHAQNIHFSGRFNRRFLARQGKNSRACRSRPLAVLRSNSNLVQSVRDKPWYKPRCWSTIVNGYVEPGCVSGAIKQSVYAVWGVPI